MKSSGVCYIAYGANAVKEATESIRTLRKFHDWRVVCAGDDVQGADHIEWPDYARPGRWAKVNLWYWTPFEHTLFLDADTRIHGDLSAGFKALEDGFDMAIVPSAWQDRPLHHLKEQERVVTLSEMGDSRPLMYNSGVIWFAKNDRTRRFFAAWANEWKRWMEHDQGALMRALEYSPVRLWVMGRAFNGGEVVEHLFGRAKQR